MAGFYLDSQLPHPHFLPPIPSIGKLVALAGNSVIWSLADKAEAEYGQWLEELLVLGDLF